MPDAPDPRDAADGAADHDDEPNRPTALLDEVLMTLVIEFLFFLEHADAKEVAPEAAKRMAQEIAFQVGRVPPQELSPLIEFVRKQAQLSGWPAEREFLERMPGYFGWH